MRAASAHPAGKSGMGRTPQMSQAELGLHAVARDPLGEEEDAYFQARPAFFTPAAEGSSPRRGGSAAAGGGQGPRNDERCSGCSTNTVHDKPVSPSNPGKSRAWSTEVMERQPRLEEGEPWRPETPDLIITRFFYLAVCFQPVGQTRLSYTHLTHSSTAHVRGVQKDQFSKSATPSILV